jgi:hypothetical protein
MIDRIVMSVSHLLYAVATAEQTSRNVGQVEVQTLRRRAP